MAYFPMFINLENKRCLIVGGGRIAHQKVKVLSDFGGNITVIAKNISDDIKFYKNVNIIEREFKETDLENAFLVVAATDDKELNHNISKMAVKKSIHINAVDQIEDCGFIFPSYVKENEVVAAFSSGGQSPVITQYLKNNIKGVLNPKLGQIAKNLGGLREFVKTNVKTEEKRKLLYKEILSLSLLEDDMLEGDKINEIMNKYI